MDVGVVAYAGSPADACLATLSTLPATAGLPPYHDYLELSVVTAEWISHFPAQLATEDLVPGPVVPSATVRPGNMEDAEPRSYRGQAARGNNAPKRDWREKISDVLNELRMQPS